MSGTGFDAGDAGIDLVLSIATGTLDGTTIDTARLVVNGPGGARELAVDITDASTTSVELTHTTTSSSFPQPGKYLAQASFYASGGAFLRRSLERPLPLVESNQVPSPEDL